MTSTRLFELHRWTVTQDGDEYTVRDHDGDPVEDCDTLPEAITSCQEAAETSYRERLWDAIQEADPDGIPSYTLAAIAEMLGLNPETI